MENIPNLVVKRKEEEMLKNLRGWVLVYGRRKTGKTFMLRKIFPHSNYFVVTRSGDIAVLDGNGFSYTSIPEAIKRIGRLLKEKRIVILDEFQRLDPLAISFPFG